MKKISLALAMLLPGPGLKDNDFLLKSVRLDKRGNSKRKRSRFEVRGW